MWPRACKARERAPSGCSWSWTRLGPPAEIECEITCCTLSARNLSFCLPPSLLQLACADYNPLSRPQTGIKANACQIAAHMRSSRLIEQRIIIVVKVVDLIASLGRLVPPTSPGDKLQPLAGAQPSARAPVGDD